MFRRISSRDIFRKANYRRVPDTNLYKHIIDKIQLAPKECVKGRINGQFADILDTQNQKQNLKVDKDPNDILNKIYKKSLYVPFT